MPNCNIVSACLITIMIINNNVDFGPLKLLLENGADPNVRFVAPDGRKQLPTLIKGTLYFCFFLFFISFFFIDNPPDCNSPNSALGCVLARGGKQIFYYVYSE